VLSYYNQPDHPVIDRRDAAARALLLRLAAVRTHLMPVSDEPASATDANVAPANASGVVAASVAASVPSQGGFSAAGYGLPEPTAVGKPIDNTEVLALWRGQRVALVGDTVDPAPLRDRGLEVFVWPADDAQAQTAVVAQLAQKLS
jgi:hypothetical protein